MGTSLLVSAGAVSCYPAPMVKNLVRWWQIFEVLQLQPQKKRAKRSHLCVCGDSWTFTCLSKTGH